MKELLLEIFGWLGYLERPSMLLQLGLVIAVVLLTRRAKLRRWLQTLPLLAYTPVGILTLAMACGGPRRPGPGEVLMLDGDPCEVRSLGLRATLLWRDRDNAELLIPNQTFFTEAAYHHDPAEVIALQEATALEVPRVLPAPGPKALLLNYGDSAIHYALRFWIANPMDNVGICSEVNQAIWQDFRRDGFEIPFPNRCSTPWRGPRRPPEQAGQ
jgi:hypothetical protein